MSKSRAGRIAVLDIGTSKIVCLIAQLADDASLRITGIGHQLAQGVKSGGVSDIKQLEQSIVSAVHAAEQMAGETIEHVTINVSCGHPSSARVKVQLPVTGGEVSDRELLRILEQGRAAISQEEKTVINVVPLNYTLDEESGIRDPRGMYGSHLSANLHVVLASRSPVKNITACISRCHLAVESMLESSSAAGLACLEEDEKELGVCVIDMGGGATKFSVFTEGRHIYTSSIAIGGIHVTSDIARGLSTTMAAAERIKTLYGSAVSSPKDGQQMIDVPPLGDPDDEEPHTIPRSMLVGIIRPRLEEIFEMVRANLENTGFDKVAGKRAVITGGASQLIGVRDLAGQVLGKQVRLARPKIIEGMADATSTAAFSTVAGLLHYAAAQRSEGVQSLSAGGRPPWWKKALLFIRENF